MRDILILGIGNILLSDEGFGIRAMEYLKSHYQWPENIRFVDGGTGGLLLMSELLECDIAIILDVVRGSEKSGTFYLLENEDLNKSLSFRESMHQTSLTDILVCCDLAGNRPETLIFGFEPFDYQTVKAELTPDALTLLPSFCYNVACELKKRGIVTAIAKPKDFSRCKGILHNHAK